MGVMLTNVGVLYVPLYVSFYLAVGFFQPKVSLLKHTPYIIEGGCGLFKWGDIRVLQQGDAAIFVMASSAAK